MAAPERRFVALGDTLNTTPAAVALDQALATRMRWYARER